MNGLSKKKQNNKSMPTSVKMCLYEALDRPRKHVFMRDWIDPKTCIYEAKDERQNCVSMR